VATLRRTTGVASIVTASLSLLGFLAFTVHAGQSPAAPTTISGRVFAADTNEPLPNARVTLTGPNDFHAVVLTRVDDGGFTFANVPPGVYRLSSAKAGYVRSEFGASGFGVSGALLVDGRPLGEIQMGLARGAAVSGRVVDVRGDPVANQTVTATWGGDDAGRGAIAIVATRTDDLGEYRLGGLPGGTLQIHLGGLPPPRPPSVTPISRLVEPRLVTLDAGEERTSLDFVLQRPMQVVEYVTHRSTTTGVAIRGRIVSDDGRPLDGAMVMLLAPDDTPVSRINVSDFIDLSKPSMRPLITTFTDESGQYEFRDVRPGRYRVGARMNGHVPMGFDRPRASALGRLIAVASERINGVDITLPRLGAVSGRITDESGSPIEGALVTIVETRFEDGRRVLVQPSGVGVRPSDDRGQYRVFGIEPGRYFVRAGAGDPGGLRYGLATGSEMPGYMSSFFPGTPVAADAASVDVGPSGNVTGVDFPLVRTATATVSGRILMAQNQTFGGRLEISPRWRGELVAAGSSGAIVDRDGRFEFRDVAPGEYVISFYRGRNGSTEGEFGAMRVSVGGDNVSGVSLTTFTGSTLHGRVIFDGSTSLNTREVAMSTMPTDVEMAPRGGEVASATPDADGMFTLEGITGTRRLRLLRAPAGWALESITSSGVDITDAALRFGTAAQSIDSIEVVLTNRPTQISGEVTDANGRHVSRVAIVAFAANRDRWYPASRFVQCVTSADGMFAIQGLPAGEYLLAAVPRTKDLDAGAWQDRTILAELAAGATRISFAGEQHLVVKLQISTQ